MSYYRLRVSAVGVINYYNVVYISGIEHYVFRIQEQHVEQAIRSAIKIICCIQLAFYFHILLTMHGQNHIKQNVDLFRDDILEFKEVKILLLCGPQGSKQFPIPMSLRMIQSVERKQKRNFLYRCSRKFDNQNCNDFVIIIIIIYLSRIWATC